MKTFMLTFLSVVSLSLSAQDTFESFFIDGRLRYDYVVTGNSSQMNIAGYKIYKEDVWGGTHINLLDSFLYGDMLLEVYDSASQKLIFSSSYSTLFKEWQTTTEAYSVQKSFLETVTLPMPEHPIKLCLYNREKNLEYNLVHECFINPDDMNINHLKQPASTHVRSIKNMGLSSEKIDLVFISEGYTKKQKNKFFKDAHRFAKTLFTWNPYPEFSQSFNIYAVFTPSDETGTDNPTEYSWMNTALNSTFNTFSSQRYLTISDQHLLHNNISAIPYDQVCVLVNSDKYGGGGIYNFFTVITVDNKYSDFLFHHEFGHAFSALADEYYTDDVSYDVMFDLNIEPCQPNITTCIDFDKKWKALIADTIPIPTPDSSLYNNTVGVYEGAAYSAKGIFRPYLDCSMKSVLNNAFCPVCQDAIRRMIRYQTSSGKKK